MAVLTTVTLLCLVLGYDNLLVLTLLYDLACNSSLQITSLNAAFIRDCKDFIESYLFTGFTSKLLNEDLVSDCNLVLLSACLDNCVHSVSSCSSSLAALLEAVPKSKK